MKRKWTDKWKIDFEKTKSIPDETEFLVYYDLGKPLILACDASPYGLYAVLSHQMIVKNQQHLPLGLFQRLRETIRKLRKKL